MCGVEYLNASKFKFGDLSNEALTTPQNEELTGCFEYPGAQLCKLKRSSFGGVAIRRFDVKLYRDRLVRMYIEIALTDYDKTFDLLNARYGTPNEPIKIQSVVPGCARTHAFRQSAGWVFGRGLLSIGKVDNDRDKAHIEFYMPERFLAL